MPTSLSSSGRTREAEKVERGMMMAASWPRCTQYPDVYFNFGLVAPDGRLICSGLQVGPENVADRQYFRRVLETRALTISEYVIERATALLSQAADWGHLQQTWRSSVVTREPASFARAPNS